MNPRPATGAQCQQLAALVDAIEQEMRNLALWSDRSPSRDALASRTPFCYDTLQFWQWLQWILVPRMRQILAEGYIPPFASDIAPLAEVEFRRLGQDTQLLLDNIRAFDRLIASLR